MSDDLNVEMTEAFERHAAEDGDADAVDAPLDASTETPVDASDGADGAVSGRVGDVWGRLMSTEPNPSLDSLTVWNPERGGARRIARGAVKLSGIAPDSALADLLVGTAEALASRTGGGGDTDDRAADAAGGPPVAGADR